MYNLNIKEFVKEVGENAIDHGWWDGEERSFGELIALCHSELSEALEEYRKGKNPNDTYYSCKTPSEFCGVTPDNCEGCEFLGKPEGIPSELADVVIRIFDMCHHYGIDIESMLIEKHEFNKSRPYKHGGKVI
jgi:NTP pyrophosphatase (non-canonical NTP hydrolase)